MPGRASRRFISLFALAMTVQSVSSSTPAEAGGFGIPEMGVRRTGMAAVIGRPDEPAAVAHNPAGLSLLSGTRLYLSMGLAAIDSEFRLAPWPDSERFVEQDVEADGRYPTTEPSRAFGVIPMLVATTELIEDRLHVAGAMYVSNATGSAFDENAVTRYHLIDGYIVAPQVSVLASYKVHPTLAVAAGAGLMHIRVHGRRHLFPIINGTDASAFIGTRTELLIDGRDNVPTWNGGLLYSPHRRVSLGASIIGRTDARIEGPVEVQVGDDVGGGMFYGDQKTELLLPWTFMAGANVDVHPSLELGSEVRYWLYRQYDEQRIDVEGLPFITELVTPKNYRDSWQVSGGARLHSLPAVPALEGMLGFHYDRTPAPPQTVSLDQPTFSHIGLHSGLRWQTGRFRLGLSYIRYWYDIPTITGSMTLPPSNVSGEGRNNIITATVEATLDRLVGWQ